jgi:L-glyceraldehyde 3-phosphate reductase
LDESLKRLGVDYVDIFYSHRFDPDTPLEETMSALVSAYRQGKALYVGISSYNAEKTEQAYEILSRENVPLLIHQPSYSMLNRWPEAKLFPVLKKIGTGSICFSPLAQGMLSTKYLNGIPENCRVREEDSSFSKSLLTESNLTKVRNLNAIAQRRGQSLAQMALAWCMRREEVTSVLIGASSSEQIKENVGALDHADFSKEELQEIDKFAQEGHINIWNPSDSK